MERPIEQRPKQRVPYLSEDREGATGNWTEHWMIWPPNVDERYRVLEDEWDEKLANRYIYAIERVPKPAPPRRMPSPVPDSPPNDPDEVGRRFRWWRRAS